METKLRGMEVEETRAYLHIPFKESKLSFIAPAFGPGTSAQVGNRILKAKLEQPTMEQTASLVHEAWQNPDEEYFSDILTKLRANRLWPFNGLLYTPKEGIYVEDRPEIKKGFVVMDESDLIKKLEAKDTSVRFIPYGFKREYQTSGELEKNPFIQALAGEEGAELLAEAADKYEGGPYVRTLDSKDITRPVTRVAALYSRWGFGSRLVVDGNGRRDPRYGYAFGVSREVSAGSAEQNQGRGNDYDRKEFADTWPTHLVL